MDSLESAQEAIQGLTNYTFSGRQLKVELATGKAVGSDALIDDRSVENTILEQRNRKRAEGNEVCFDLLNGRCSRGSSCKFLHYLPEEFTADNNSSNAAQIPTTPVKVTPTDISFLQKQKQDVASHSGDRKEIWRDTEYEDDLNDPTIADHTNRIRGGSAQVDLPNDDYKARKNRKKQDSRENSRDRTGRTEYETYRRDHTRPDRFDRMRESSKTSKSGE